MQHIEISMNWSYRIRFTDCQKQNNIRRTYLSNLVRLYGTMNGYVSMDCASSVKPLLAGSRRKWREDGRSWRDDGRSRRHAVIIGGISSGNRRHQHHLYDAPLCPIQFKSNPFIQPPSHHCRMILTYPTQPSHC